MATDGVIATMMGLEPGQLRFLQKAKAVGLGDYDWRMIEVLGELKQLPDFKVPPLHGEGNLQDANLKDLLHSRTVL
ncbi:MAG: hypothetical protein ABSC55_21710 [Syntrophorhabdales bacterium]